MEISRYCRLKNFHIFTFANFHIVRMGMGKKYYCIAAILLWSALVHAQPFADTLPALDKPVVYDKNYSTPFIMGDIFVEGNKRTKSYIIQRELPFKSGDSIYLTDLVKAFEIARQQLF